MSKAYTLLAAAAAEGLKIIVEGSATTTNLWQQSCWLKVAIIFVYKQQK